MWSINCVQLLEHSRTRERGRIPAIPWQTLDWVHFLCFLCKALLFWIFSERCKRHKEKNNAHSLFGVFKIPTDNHIRSLLDSVEPASVYPLFDFVFDGFQRAGVIDSFRISDNRLLLALDGTQYFSSQKLQGSCCSCKTHSNGKISYSHTVMTPVLVKPGSDKVIALAPEFVSPQDGHKKQDCEINASLRWLERQGSQFADGTRRWSLLSWAILSCLAE